jgi:hypothetical protein
LASDGQGGPRRFSGDFGLGQRGKKEKEKGVYGWREEDDEKGGFRGNGSEGGKRKKERESGLCCRQGEKEKIEKKDGKGKVVTGRGKKERERIF